jgi:hypothetical protein
MNKLIAILLLAVATILPQNISGDGTAGTPYLLYNAADFDSIRILGYTKDYKIMNNIDFTSWGTFIPFPGVFTGHLDLNHKTISDLNWVDTFNGTDDDTIGLFQVLAGGSNAAYTKPQIRNGKFIDCSATITGSPQSGNTYSGVGFLAGVMGSSGGWTAGKSMIDSLVFLNLRVLITASTRSNGSGYGGIIGINSSSTVPFSVPINRVHVEGELLVNADEAYRIQTTDGVGGIIGFVSSPGLADITKCAFIGRVVVQPITTFPSGLGHPVGGILGRPQQNSGSDWPITDCFFRGVIKTQEYFAGGLIGHFTVGPMEVSTSYTQIDTIVAWQTVTEDRDGLIFGAPADNGVFTSLYADSQSVVLDTLDNGDPDFTLRGYTEVIDPGTGLTTAQAKDSSYYDGFDFENVWAWNPSLNDSYPYLQWYPLGTPIVLTLDRPNGGDIWQWPDSIDIRWSQNDDSDSTHYVLWYTLNNGATWTFIDSVRVDTSYYWTFPNVNSNAVKFQVNDRDSVSTDISTAVSTILSGPEINILYPRNITRTVILGDTTHIILETANIDSVLLFFSQDTTVIKTYNFIEGLSVDTTNGFLYDTTTYIWTMTGLGLGDIYIKAITQADTTVYYNTGDVILDQIGPPQPNPPVYCTSSGPLQTPLEYQTREDPSCGWSSPTYTFNSGNINADGTDYDILQESFNWPYTGAHYPTRTGVWLVSGGDTTLTPLRNIYTNVSDDTLIYKNRRYWYSTTDTSIYMDDMTNNIDSMKLLDLGPYTGAGKYWQNVPMYIMQVYNIQYDKISGDTLSSSLDFETLNDPFFTPLIIMFGKGGAFNLPYGISMTLLPTPNNQDYAEDIVKAFNDPIVQRFYFRGIHPKAEKR